MAEQNRQESSGRVLFWASLALATFVVLIVVSGLVLTSRGRTSIEASDVAFHQGELRESLAHAKKAALSYVPGAEHVRLAHDRMEAIARGAEALGDVQLARGAWDALRVVCEQTDYAGRVEPASYERALQSLRRLREPEKDGQANR